MRNRAIGGTACGLRSLHPPLPTTTKTLAQESTNKCSHCYITPLSQLTAYQCILHLLQPSSHGKQSTTSTSTTTTTTTTTTTQTCRFIRSSDVHGNATRKMRRSRWRRQNASSDETSNAFHIPEWPSVWIAPVPQVTDVATTVTVAPPNGVVDRQICLDFFQAALVVLRGAKLPLVLLARASQAFVQDGCPCAIGIGIGPSAIGITVCEGVVWR